MDKDMLYDLYLKGLVQVLPYTTKICKNCGKSFIYKESYNIQYCNGIAEWENKTCKEIGASRTYLEKIKNNPILEEYSRAYKTHYARIKYGKITKSQFKQWAAEATVMRDKALNNEIAFKEFKNWLKN